jgi:hypothetical protein
MKTTFEEWFKDGYISKIPHYHELTEDIKALMYTSCQLAWQICSNQLIEDYNRLNKEVNILTTALNDATKVNKSIGCPGCSIKKPSSSGLANTLEINKIRDEYKKLLSQTAQLNKDYVDLAKEFNEAHAYLDSIGVAKDTDKKLLSLKERIAK